MQHENDRCQRCTAKGQRVLNLVYIEAEARESLHAHMLGWFCAGLILLTQTEQTLYPGQQRQGPQGL